MNSARIANLDRDSAAWAVSLAAVGLVAWFVTNLPGWGATSAIAATEFGILKLATLRGACAGASRARRLGYLVFWPGMNARAFLGPRALDGARPAVSELVGAAAKLALGLGLLGWAIRHAWDVPPLRIGWVAMVGIIFTLHFGVFHVLSWIWRSRGIAAPPLMRAPILALTLSEFWAERWNVAFAESARRFLLRPLARRWGVTRAGAAVFLVSGLVHESVISLPARGGWGGPTLYFLLQAAGIAVEKSPWGRRLGLGAGSVGRLWTLAVTALPLPLLFHAAFVERVILPLVRALALEVL